MTRHRGRRDQAARAALAPLVASGSAVCWRCRRPIRPDEPWDAGHVVGLADGGAPDGERAPEHVRCNRGAGGRRRWRAPVPSRRVDLGAWLRVLLVRRPLRTHRARLAELRAQ